MIEKIFRKSENIQRYDTIRKLPNDIAYWRKIQDKTDFLKGHSAMPREYNLKALAIKKIVDSAYFDNKTWEKDFQESTIRKYTPTTMDTCIQFQTPSKGESSGQQNPSEISTNKKNLNPKLDSNPKLSLYTFSLEYLNTQEKGTTAKYSKAQFSNSQKLQYPFCDMGLEYYVNLG